MSWEESQELLALEGIMLSICTESDVLIFYYLFIRKTALIFLLNIRAKELHYKFESYLIKSSGKIEMGDKKIAMNTS